MSSVREPVSDNSFVMFQDRKTHYLVIILIVCVHREGDPFWVKCSNGSNKAINPITAVPCGSRCNDVI